MGKKQVIERMYSHGWNPEYVKFVPVKGGIKVKGSLTRMNWGCVKFELYDMGYTYDRGRKIFVKTHGNRLLRIPKGVEYV